MIPSKKRTHIAATLAICVLALAVPATASTADPTPRGLHLAYGADPQTSMTVVWHTQGTTHRNTVVQFGASEGLGRTATGITKQTPGLPASLSSMLHEVVLTGLEAGAPFYYRAGDGTNWSPVRRASTAPADASFSFAAFGDHGITPQAAVTTAALAASGIDFAVLAGDVSYANSRLERWDTWAELTEPFAAATPLMAAPGNHETDPGQTPTPQAFIDRFAYPDGELYYAFDVGRVHFLVLHSTIDSSATRQAVAEQLVFAERDLLVASQRKIAGDIDFIIVVQHHPLYGSQDVSLTAGAAGRNMNAPLIAWQERLFAETDVDLLIVGHNHHYERTYPMRLGQPTTSEPSDYVAPDGFIETITGGGGAGLYDLKSPEDAGAFSAVRHKRFHYVRFDVEPGVLRATTIATDNDEVLDSWTLRAS